MRSFISSAGFEMTFKYGQLIWQGLVITVLLALLTVVIGFILGVVLALMRMTDIRPFRFLGLDKDGHLRGKGFLLTLSKFNPVSFLASVYVEVIRSTPMVVQILIIYLGIFGQLIRLPRFTMLGFIKFDRFFPGVVALGLNSGAYLCEIIRSGIQSIDGGQTEAARSLGMTQVQNMRYIVLPQAIKNILPAIANEFVTIIKESSICWTIGVQEIMSAVNSIKAATFTIGEALIIAACVYFCLTFPTSKIIEYFERKMSRGDKR